MCKTLTGEEREWIREDGNKARLIDLRLKRRQVVRSSEGTKRQDVPKIASFWNE